MTKVLLVTSKSDVTSDFVIRALKKRNIDFYRLNTDEVTKTILLTMDFNPPSARLYDSNLAKYVELTQFNSVYYRRPELPEFNIPGITNGEALFIQNEITYALEGVYKLLESAYWVSPLYSIRQAENKVWQLQIANSIGFNIPRSIISNSYSEITEFYKTTSQCVVKPIKSGLIAQDQWSSVIFTSTITELPDDPEAVQCCPIYLQQEIRKVGDIRVTVVGKKVFSTFIESQVSKEAVTDWRRSSTPLKHIRHELPKSLEEKCISLLNYFNLRFGAIDLILDENDEYHFLEINPNGQWAWIENQIGYPISNEIVNLLTNEISI